MRTAPNSFCSPGDDIASFCIEDNGQAGVFDAPDIVLFSLTSATPTVKAGLVSSADILQAIPPPVRGFGVVARATSLGLGNQDQITGLKCYKPRKDCDINLDGRVDKLDIDLIFSARNTPAVPGDPRDVDGDGQITVNDARVCTLRCTAPLCATL